MKKKLCALLALAMLLCLLPALAMAEDCYVRVVDASGAAISEGFSRSSDGKLTIEESGLIIQGVSESCPDRLWEPVTKINILAGVNRVTLKDVQLEGTSTVLSADSDVAIKVEGHTVLRTTAQGNTTVAGEGNLTINVGKGAELKIYGPASSYDPDSHERTIAKVLDVNGDLVIAGAEGKVSIVGKSHYYSEGHGTNGCGISADGNITISASNVTIKNEDIGGTDTDAAEVITTSRGDIIISGSHVTVAGGNGKGDEAEGSTAIITNDGDVIISGSDVTITGGNADGNLSAYSGCGINANKVTISGSNVSVSGGSITDATYTLHYPAISSKHDVTISGSNMRATSNGSSPAIRSQIGSLILQVPAQESADGENWTALEMNNPNHTQPYFLTATVSDGVAGEVETAPAGGGQAGVPRTGDSANIALWLAMLAGSAAAMCAISGRKRKA